MKVASSYWYNSVELISSTLGIKSMKIGGTALLLILMTGFIPYFEEYIFFNFVCFILFNISMVFDIISAIMLSKLRGGSFETNKGMKAMIKLIGYNYLLYLSHQINKFFADSNMSESIYKGLSTFMGESVSDMMRLAFDEYNLSPYTVFLYAFIIISFSAIKNFQLADVFENVKRFDVWIYRHIDIYKNRPTDRLWNTMSVNQQKKITNKLDVIPEKV